MKKTKSYSRNRISRSRYLYVRFCFLIADLIFILPLFFLSIISRFFAKKIDVGLGATPIINSIYHKKCFELYGYSCETYVNSNWGQVDDFDVKAYQWVPVYLKPFIPYLLFVWQIFRYKSVFIYFSGASLNWTTLLVYLEPIFLKIAGVKIVMMAFGADVNELTRTSNLKFVDGMAQDYPGYRHDRHRVSRLIDVYTYWADYILSGCDWVDYMFYWDQLMLSHFAIDAPPRNNPETGAHDTQDFFTLENPLKLLHAPNHRALKGTNKIIKAVEELKSEGYHLELSLLEKMPNSEVLKKIDECDIVLDQLIIGWYAVFCLEGMVRSKPVICYLRNDLIDLYENAGLIENGELPHINSNSNEIKATLTSILNGSRSDLREKGASSRRFVEKHHSLEFIGKIFDEICKGQNIGKLR